MKKEILTSKNAPKAIGPYSQGVFINGFYYFSGQIPLDSESGEMVKGGIKEQTAQVLKNISELLKSNGLKPVDVVKTTVFLTDMQNFATVNELYAEFFNSEPPARSCVAVAELPKNALVEIEIIASRVLP